jgi:hypothetical protein
MSLCRIAVLVSVAVLFALPRAVDAQASGNTFSVSVLSSVSGSFGGVLAFESDGTFVFKPNSGEKGTGNYTETVDTTTLNSTVTAYGTNGDGYAGLFYSQTYNTTINTTPYLLIGGIGAGNAGDIYLFAGYVANPTTSSGSAAAIKPRLRRR